VAGGSGASAPCVYREHDHVGSPASNSPVSGSYFSDRQSDVGLANVRDYNFHENSIIRFDTVVVFLCFFSTHRFINFFPYDIL